MRVYYLIAIITLVIILIFLLQSKSHSGDTNTKKSEPKNEFQYSKNGKIMILNQDEKDKNFDKIKNLVEFRFVNLSPKNILVYYEPNTTKDLEFITKINKGEYVYIYPLDEDFKPGVTLFSKFEDDNEGEFAYRPYELYYMDYSIYFGEISTDFLRSDNIKSDRNEILSLKIENRSLKKYHVWYYGNYLGSIDPFYPGKFDIEYSLLTRNDDKHFQLGTWIDFIMDSPDAGKQSIQLKNKSTTNIIIGDVVGRTQ